jgi:predicted RNase H-like HicB family nuclease
MKLVYPAIFYPDKETGAYAVEVPDLPGCATGGDSFAEAQEMAIDAASGWVLVEVEEGKLAPEARDIKSIQPEEEGAFVSMLVLDMNSYAEKYGKKAVRKNLTIPAWLNTFAEENNINFSKVLQKSLIGIYQKKTCR